MQSRLSSTYAASAGDIALGVASLDPPLVQQTKAEIRSLAAEIAKLAHATLTPAEFYGGFLPRLCLAMGASAAGVWELSSVSTARLVANHGLPSLLLACSDPPKHSDSGSPDLKRDSDGQFGSEAEASTLSGSGPSDAHAPILACVAAEAKPILVPPKTVTIDADRPKNPLDEALIIVPVQVEDNVGYVLEIVQPPTGGPAAQRGYLRFAAQMADLLADFLRRHTLRELVSHRDRLERFEQWLLKSASEPDIPQRIKITADALCDLLEGDQAIIVQVQRQVKVLSISGVSLIDPRSEVVLAVQDFISTFVQNEPSASNEQAVWNWFEAIQPGNIETQDRISSGVGSVASSDPDQRGQAGQRHDRDCQSHLEYLLEMLRCRQLLLMQLDESRRFYGLVTLNCSTDAPALPRQLGERTIQARARALGTLLTLPDAERRWSWCPGLLRADAGKSPGQTYKTSKLAWSLAVAAALLCMVGLPVPQQISASAMLQPAERAIYYAPMHAVVQRVYVSESQHVARNAPLIQLRSRELESEIEHLQGELQTRREQISDLTAQLDSGNELPAHEFDRLESELEKQRIASDTEARMLQVLQQKRDDLLVVARQSGRVATWYVRNRLQQRPVATGEVLLTTYAPEGAWKLELAIPDYRAGLVAEAIAKAQQQRSESGALVRFSLSSHPDQLYEARLVKLASRATLRPAKADDATRVILGQAELDARLLPLLKDGAVARAIVDCGRVPLGWLIIRDAYQAIRSRLLMMW